MIDGIHYLNSGDWVETLSALTEYEEGVWKVRYYTEMVELKEKAEKDSVLSIIPVAS